MNPWAGPGRPREEAVAAAAGTRGAGDDAAGAGGGFEVASSHPKNTREGGELGRGFKIEAGIKQKEKRKKKNR